MSAQDVSRQTTKAKLAEVKAKAATFREIVRVARIRVSNMYLVGVSDRCWAVGIFMPSSGVFFYSYLI